MFLKKREPRIKKEKWRLSPTASPGHGRATPSTHTRENKKFFFLSQIFPFFIFCFKFRSVEFFTQFTTNFPFFFKKNYPVFFTENINEEKNIKFSSLASWLDFLKDYNTPVGRKS